MRGREDRLLDYRLAASGCPEARSHVRNYLLLACFPGDPRHGTLTGYAHGCRCDRCRAARHGYEAARWRRGKE